MSESNTLKAPPSAALGHARSPSSSSIASVTSNTALNPAPQHQPPTASQQAPSQPHTTPGLPPLLIPKPQQETVRQHEHSGVDSDDESNANKTTPPTVFGSMTNDHKLDIRANQRTFEGAYVRTALGQLSFALVILKIFSREFLPIGTVFTVQGILILVIAFYRRHKTIKDIFTVSGGYRALSQDHNIVFQTSGPTVLLLSSISILTYIALFILIQRLSPNYGDS